MFLFFDGITANKLQLESGDGNLIFEGTHDLLLQSSLIDVSLQLEDGTGVYLLESSGEYLHEESNQGAAGSVNVVEDAGHRDQYPDEYRYWAPFFSYEIELTVLSVFEAAWQNLSTFLMPNVRNEDLYGEAHNYPYVFGGTINPDDQVNPHYQEAWQNLATTLMPEVDPQDLYGRWPLGMSGGSYFIMQLSTPIFPPDGISPTTAITQASLTGTSVLKIEFV